MRRLLTLLACFCLIAFLAACGGGGGHPYGIPAQFGDSDPFHWRGRVPSKYDVHGIDVSKYQGVINWERVAAADVRFAFIKATEGGDVEDPMFLTNWYGAQNAGIPRGAYHFYYFCRTAQEQAEWFIRHVPVEPGALPPVLDIEWTQSRNCPGRPDPEHVRSEAATFLAILTQYYGQKPMIYTTVDFWVDNQMWLIDDYPFWLRSVAGHPRDVYDGGHHWTLWQYTGTGRVPGIDGDVDLNAFAGTAKSWAAWLASHRR